MNVENADFSLKKQMWTSMSKVRTWMLRIQFGSNDGSVNLIVENTNHDYGNEIFNV